MKPTEDWIKPGVSVTSVEKKINKPSHTEVESDSDNDDSDDDSYNDKQITSMKENEEKIIGPSEINETNNESEQKMDVDDSEMPKVDKTDHFVVNDEKMQD